jgi:hypothetical protein
MAKLQKPTAAKARKRGARLAPRRMPTTRRQRPLSAALRLALSRNSGWRRVEDQFLSVDPASLIGSVSNLTVDPTTTAKILADAETADRKRFERLTIKELVAEAIRELLIIHIVVQRALQKQLTATKLLVIGRTMLSTAQSFKALVIASVEAQKIPSPTSAADAPSS